LPKPIIAIFKSYEEGFWVWFFGFALVAEEEQEDWRRGERVVVVMGLILGVKMRDFDGGKQGGTGERERREGFGGGRRREEKEGIFLVFRKRQLSLSCLEKQWSLSLKCLLGS
jgi:hypothetical protein